MPNIQISELETDKRWIVITFFYRMFDVIVSVPMAWLSMSKIFFT